MSKSLTVRNAEIHTARVQVSVLTISGKQVTLSVFRQLPVLQPINREYGPVEWLGEPWGWVNYKREDFESTWIHRSKIKHVVFEKDNSLYRGPFVDPDCWFAEEVEFGPGRKFIVCDRYLDNKNCTYYNDPEGYERQYRQRWDELIRTPQLFIAV